MNIHFCHVVRMKNCYVVSVFCVPLTSPFAVIDLINLTAKYHFLDLEELRAVKHCILKHKTGTSTQGSEKRNIARTSLSVHLIIESAAFERQTRQESSDVSLFRVTIIALCSYASFAGTEWQRNCSTYVIQLSLHITKNNI